MEVELAKAYGTKGPFLTTPSNLVFESLNTVKQGMKSYKPSKGVMFSNPGVLTEGQFPLTYATVPNADMWQDEAYNNVTKRLADDSKHYFDIFGNRSAQFPLGSDGVKFQPDPVVKSLLEDRERLVGEVLGELAVQTDILQREADIAYLQQRGLTSEEVGKVLSKRRVQEALNELTGVSPKKKV
jgi:hypothetical protein